MNPWFAKAVVLAACVVMVAIRAPHGKRSRKVPVAVSQKSWTELVLLFSAWLSFFIPLVWVARPILRFADYPLHIVPFAAGTICLGIGLWLFFRSHADLGRNWSITLELRSEHELVRHGVYRTIRHPMYSSLLLYSVGQALVLPNWIAGPSYLVAMLLLLGLRLGPEEKMMRDRFGDVYRDYAAHTKRLIPGLW